MKKKILIIITFLLILCEQNMIVNAEEKTVYSDGYFYYHLEDGYVSICGYFGKEEEVTIPSSIIALPVSRIEAGAFEGCDTVKKVILPDTIMEVQNGAFTGAEQLNRVEDADGKNKPEYVEETTKIPDGASKPGDEQSPSQPDNTVNQNTPQSDKVGENQYIEQEDDSKSTIENEKNLQKIEAALSQPQNLTDEVKVDSEGRLITVDQDGKKTVIDDTHTYTQKKDGTIVDEDGNIVQTKEERETTSLNEKESEIKDSKAKDSRLWKLRISVGIVVFLVISGAFFLFRKYKKKR